MDHDDAPAAGSESPLARARSLENSSRPAEAEAAVRPLAARAARVLPRLLARLVREASGEGEAPRSRYWTLLEFDPFRRAFLARLARRPADLGRVASAMRAALDGDPARNAVRTLLGDVLLVQGKQAAAERLAKDAFRRGRTGGEDSRFRLLLRLVDRGRYGRALERSVLARLWEASPSDRLLVEWSQFYSALMCTGRYRAAFRVAEAVLDKLGRFESLLPLQWPWWRRVGRAVNEERFLARELQRLRAASRSGRFPHWFAYYRAVLSGQLGRLREALAEFPRLARLAPNRYSWMRQAFVPVHLERLDFRGVIAACRAVLRHAPDQWWVRCRMAEAYLALGDHAEALRQLRRARAGADPRVVREVLTWHGEVLLWLGRYRAALRLLDRAIRLGATTFVYGWRGAARLKLGDAEGALEDLDRAIELDAKDIEAYVWRGEAHRLAGRYAAALRDLDRFLESQPDCCWGLFNRGLVRAELGDDAGLAADLAAVPRGVDLAVRRRLDLPDDRALTAAEQRALATAALELGRGIRRWEPYLYPIWLGRDGRPVERDARRRARRGAGGP
ncbi:MAG: tetratricopeptide repeat protein [Deltaproteobacteria bacterium]|nr:tetratricopeptide repeat protein [Deltaproteobacteria bacterium]